MKDLRWEREQSEVTTAYPSAQWGNTTRPAANYEAWTLRVNPLPAADELALVLADLAAGRVVGVRRGGRVAHLDQCLVPADEHRSPLSNVPEQQFTLEFVYPERELGPIGPVHPQVRVLSPEISARTQPQHPHLYRAGGDSWACAVAPHDRDWDWKNGGTVRYLDLACIWLLKTLVWIRTGGGILGFGRWIGPDAPHDPATLLTIDPTGPCRCGTGRTYAACHKATDLDGMLVTLLAERR